LEKKNKDIFKMNKKRQIFLSILILMLVAFLMISPQLYKHSLILGNDMMFHFNRFYETYMQIKTGHFNYFQSIFGFDQSGRIINALYGPDFAYIQGLLMFLTKNWFRYQLLSSFLCFFIAGISMFFLTRKVNIKFINSLCISVMYMSSSMIYYYALGQNLTSWGAAFAPFVFIPAVRVIKNSENPINPIELTLAITSVGFLHNLTLFLVILASVPFYIIGFFHSKFKLKMIKNFIIAVFLTVLLNINTLIGFIEVYLTNELVYPRFFEDVLTYTTHFTLGSNTYSDLGLFFSCIMLFQIFFLFFNWNKSSLLEKLFTSVGLFFLVLSSNFLPWEDIAKFSSFIKVVQFPRRFTLISFIFLLISFAISLEKITENLSYEKKKIICSLMCVVSMLMVFNVNLTVLQKSKVWYTDQPALAGNNTPWLLTNDANKIRKGFSSGNYEDAFKVINKPTPDYLPVIGTSEKQEVVQKDGYKLYKDQITNNPLKVIKKIDKKNRLVIEWHSKNKDSVIVPAITYRRSTILFNKEKYCSKDIKRTTIGAPIVKSKIGNNKLVIGYNTIFSIKILFMIKLLTIGFLFLTFLRKLLR